MRCLRIEVQEGRANLKCPQCAEQLHPNDVEFLVGGDKGLLQLYQFLMVRRVLAADPDTRSILSALDSLYASMTRNYEFLIGLYGDLSIECVIYGVRGLTQTPGPYYPLFWPVMPL
jgi:hypothetical protein